MHYALNVFQLLGNCKLRGGQEAIHFVLLMLMDQEGPGPSCSHLTVTYQC